MEPCYPYCVFDLADGSPEVQFRSARSVFQDCLLTQPNATSIAGMGCACGDSCSDALVGNGNETSGSGDDDGSESSAMVLQGKAKVVGLVVGVLLVVLTAA